MVHSFDVENAKKYGLLEAVLISNFEFWIAKNKANEMNFFDGKYWVYNSARALTELFPYASEQQIKRALHHLKEKNVLISGNYNKNSYDRTLWYTFSDEYQSIIQNKTIDGSNSTDGKVDIDQPIPDNKPDNKPDNNTPHTPQGGKPRKAKLDLSITELTEILDAYEGSNELKQTLLDFIEERKKKRKPVSANALKLLLKKLDTLASQEKEKIEIVEQSIMNGWQGIFPLDKRKKSPANELDILNDLEERYKHET